MTKAFGVQSKLAKKSIQGKGITPRLIRSIEQGTLLFLVPAHRVYRFISFSCIQGACLGTANLQVITEDTEWTFPVDEGNLLEAYRIATEREVRDFMIKEML